MQWLPLIPQGDHSLAIRLSGFGLRLLIDAVSRSSDLSDHHDVLRLICASPEFLVWWLAAGAEASATDPRDRFNFSSVADAVARLEFSDRTRRCLGASVGMPIVRVEPAEINVRRNWLRSLVDTALDANNARLEQVARTEWMRCFRIEAGSLHDSGAEWLKRLAARIRFGFAAQDLDEDCVARLRSWVDRDEVMEPPLATPNADAAIVDDAVSTAAF